SIVRVKGQRQGVEAAGIGPCRVVIGVPEGGEPAGKRWGRGGRGREIAETHAGRLPSELPLAARKLGREARSIVPVALALELAEAVRPVASTRRVPLLGLGSVAPGLGTGAVDAREKECNLDDFHGKTAPGRKIIPKSKGKDEDWGFDSGLDRKPSVPLAGVT
ncbi:hypothetical protein THAOC_18329, partial [Thalassiosira oceanica]